MIKVHLLIQSEKDLILGKQYAPNSYFNPIQDNNNNWIISIEEVNNCVFSEFEWTKNCPLIDWNPKPQENI